MPKPMTDREILDLLGKFHDDARLSCSGGYPSIIDSETIRGWVVVATADSGNGDKPRLALYRWSSLRAWVRAAQAMRRRDGDMDLVEALHETSP